MLDYFILEEEETHTSGDAIEVYYDDGVVEFDSDTDSKFYTVVEADPPASSSDQLTGYLLDIRNILLIFLFTYFIFHTYTMLKNSLKSYLGGNNHG